jgi:hypothetical protein
MTTSAKTDQQEWYPIEASKPFPLMAGVTISKATEHSNDLKSMASARLEIYAAWALTSKAQIQAVCAGRLRYGIGFLKKGICTRSILNKPSDI